MSWPSCGARSRVVCERGCPTLAEITDKSHFLHTRSCCYSVKTARISLSLSSVYSSSPTLIVWPPKLGRRTLSPVFTLVGIAFPFLSLAPGPTAMTCASGLFFSVADVGKKMPEAVCEGDKVISFSSEIEWLGCKWTFCDGCSRCTSTRSSSGATARMLFIVNDWFQMIVSRCVSLCSSAQRSPPWSSRCTAVD